MIATTKFENLIFKYQEFSGLSSCTKIPCPLCMRLKACQELTEEHVIPKAIGGKIKTLSCASCNNNLGSKIDSHLKGFFDAKEFWRGNCLQRGEIIVKDVPYRVNIDKNGGWNFKASDRANDIRKFPKILPAPGEEMKVCIHHKYSREGWKRAVIKAAYLTNFLTKGYPYIHLEINKHVRKVLKGNTENDLWTYMAFDNPNIKKLGNIRGDFVFKDKKFSIITFGSDSEEVGFMAFLPCSDMTPIELEHFLQFLKLECGEDGKMDLIFNFNGNGNN